jgi:hypothetical protein
MWDNDLWSANELRTELSGVDVWKLVNNILSNLLDYVIDLIAFIQFT